MARATRGAPRKEAKLAAEKAEQDREPILGDDDSRKSQKDAGKSGLDRNVSRTKVWRWDGDSCVEVKSCKHEFKPERLTSIPDVEKMKENLCAEYEELREVGSELSKNICIFYQAQLMVKEREIGFLRQENNLLREHMDFLLEKLRVADSSVEDLLLNKLGGVDSKINLRNKLEGLFS
jgi:hypothetical protein